MFDMKKLIKSNNIEPEWLGDAPDLTNTKPPKGVASKIKVYTDDSNVMPSPNTED